MQRLFITALACVCKLSLLAQPEIFNSGLPIITINTNKQSIVDEPRITCHMGIISNSIGDNYITDSYNNYNGNISIEIRGTASQLFPKKSYSFETQDIDGSNLNTSLLGLPIENDWILYGPYYDKSLIRNSLTYNLWENMGHYATRNKFCELFINSEYKGIYLLVEKIKRDVNRINITESNDDDVSGGYIIKIDHMNISGNNISNGEYWPSEYLSIGGDSIYYQFYYPKSDEITSPQKVYLINYIKEFETNLHSYSFNDLLVGYDNYLDITAAIDFFLIQEFTKNIDAYRASTFIYKDVITLNNRLVFGPVWDFNYSYGSTTYCEGDQYSGWQNNTTCGQANPVWFERLLEDSLFTNKMHCRWNELRETTLSEDAIFYSIDSLSNLLNESIVKNLNVWNNNLTIVDYYNEIDYLKTWITNRLAWLDINMKGSCVLGELEPPSVLIYPNPASNSLTIDLGDLTGLNTTIKIYDSSSKLVFEKQSTSTLIIDVSVYAKGLYNLELSTSDKVLRSQVVIE